MEEDEAVPEPFMCPITLDEMRDPVIALDGHSYSRAAIQHHFRTRAANALPFTSPLTNEQLASDQVLPNHTLRKAIEQHRDEQRMPATTMAIDPARLDVSEELLGEGSFGRVFAGTLRNRRRGELRVAIKTLPAMNRDQERQTFTEELKKHMHAARHCDGVCILYGTCELQRGPMQGRMCIVMKRYERSLEDAIAEAGEPGLDEERVRRYSESLSRTLQELHGSGLVMRDVKPQNILLDAFDQPVFADFGIAVILETTVHRGTSIKGTWNYMAPEAFEPEAFAEGIGTHTDIWALACVMIEMRTGRRPWSGMQMQQISRAVCDRQRTPSVPEDAPAAPELRRCFEYRPTQRPTAEELAQAFALQAPEGMDNAGLVRRLADQEAITQEIIRINSRLTQETVQLRLENARLQQRVQQSQEIVRTNSQLTQETAQLRLENARLQQRVQHSQEIVRTNSQLTQETAQLRQENARLRQENEDGGRGDRAARGGRGGGRGGGGDRGPRDDQRGDSYQAMGAQGRYVPPAHRDAADGRNTWMLDEVAINQRFALAEKTKEKGNAAHTRGDFAGAASTYDKAYKLCCINGQTAEQKEKMQRLQLACLTNRALALSKLEDHTNVVAACTEALKIDLVNEKALYRRGVARSKLGLFDLAEADLHEVLKINERNRDAKTALKDLAKLRNQGGDRGDRGGGGGGGGDEEPGSLPQPDQPPRGFRGRGGRGGGGGGDRGGDEEPGCLPQPDQPPRGFRGRGGRGGGGGGDRGNRGGGGGGLRP